MIILSILIISLGIVSASENNDTDSFIKEGIDTQPIDDIEDLINNTEENGIVQLDNEYSLQANKTLRINNSITINGVENNTVINGNGNYLFLDTIEIENTISSTDVIVISPLHDNIKNNGKHIILNNITFINVHLETWHDMEFNNCNFINASFTSNELDNRFNNCIFNNSGVTLIVLKGYFYPETPYAYSEFLNCQFIESDFKTKDVYGSYYIHLDGSDFFETFDSINLANCSFSKSSVSINTVNINMTSCSFNKTNIKGHSNSINIKDSEFYNQDIDFSICKTNFIDTTFNKSNISLGAAYFSIGTETNLKNCLLNNTKIRLTPGFRSRTSQINITNSNVANSYIDSTDANVIIENSTLNRTGMLLFFSGLKISDSEIFNNNTIDNTIKTKLEEEKDAIIDGDITPMTVYYQIKTDYQIANTHFTNETGKYELTAEDISKNTLYNFTYIKQGTYYVNNQIIFVLKDCNGNPVVGEKIFIIIEGKYQPIVPSITTDENGIARYNLTESGYLTIKAYYYSNSRNFDSMTHAISFEICVNPVKSLNVYKYDFGKNIYSTIKGHLKLKITDAMLKDLSKVKLIVELIGKDKNKIYKVYTNRNGEALFDIPAKLAVGKYTLKITIDNTDITKIISFKINKAKTIVKAPKTTNQFKKSSYFKVALKNKISNKAISNVKVNIKVFTGKKFKTFTVKTDKKGIAKINTKNLKIGNHKVVISSNDNNYQISAKSMIKIIK